MSVRQFVDGSSAGREFRLRLGGVVAVRGSLLRDDLLPADGHRCAVRAEPDVGRQDVPGRAEDVGEAGEAAQSHLGRQKGRSFVFGGRFCLFINAAIVCKKTPKEIYVMSVLRQA